MIFLPYYFLADHNRLLYMLDTDIDECTEGTHQCQQNCHNTTGSYTCSCGPCYILGGDGRSCYGKLTKIAYTSLLEIFLL